MSTVLDQMRGCLGVRIVIMLWCRAFIVQVLSMDQIIIHNLFTGYLLSKNLE